MLQLLIRLVALQETFESVDSESCDTGIFYKGQCVAKCGDDMKYLDGYTCVERCESGVFAEDGEHLRCQAACPDKFIVSDTLTDGMKKCVSECPYPWLLIQGSCMLCNSTGVNPFLDPIQNKCVNTKQQCTLRDVKTDDAFICKTCADVNQTNQYWDGEYCVASCPDEKPYQFKLNDDVVTCVEKCPTSQPFATNNVCGTSCESKAFQSTSSGDICIPDQECKYFLYEEFNGEQYKKCYTHCQLAGFKYQYIDNGLCIEKCPVEKPYINIINESYAERNYCVEKCDQIFDETTNICTTCVKTNGTFWEQSNETCVEECVQAAIGGVCTICADYNMVYDPLIKFCVANEEECTTEKVREDDALTCKTCFEKDGTYWNATRCVMKCDQFAEDGVCLTCALNSTIFDPLTRECVEEEATCTLEDLSTKEEQFCRTCYEINSTFWNGTECVKNCPQTHDQYGVCMTCFEANYTFWNGTQCVEECDEVSVDGVCSYCIDHGLVYDPVIEFCVANELLCASGALLNQSTCKTCTQAGLFRDGTTCVSQCAQAHDDQHNCISCYAHNETYWNADEMLCVEQCDQIAVGDTCMTCYGLNYTYWNGEACVPSYKCPQTYSSYNGLCMSCLDQNETFWDGSQCVSDCPQISVNGTCGTCSEFNLVYDPVTKYCTENADTCQSGTLSSNPTICATCQSADLYLDGMTCTSRCPQTYNGDGVCVTCFENGEYFWDEVYGGCTEYCDEIGIDGVCARCIDWNGTYWDDRTYQCVEHCDQVVEDGYCGTCLMFYGQLWNGSTCVDKCEPYQVAVEGICNNCSVYGAYYDPIIDHCVGSISECRSEALTNDTNNSFWCASCADVGLYLSRDEYDARCVEQCDYAANETSHECVTCVEYNGTFWDGTQCVVECPQVAIEGFCRTCDEFDMVYDPVIDKCIEEADSCKSGQTQDNNDTICKTCQEAGFYQDGDECVEECQQIYNGNNVCMSCYEHNGTFWNTTQEKCVNECEYGVHEQICVVCADLKMYLDPINGYCVASADECTTGQLTGTQDRCLTCADEDKYWDGQECVQACDQFAIDGICVTCLSVYGTFWNEDLEECVMKCDQTYDGQGKCVTCEDKGLVWNGETCISRCSQLSQDGMCTTCFEKNHTFWNYTKCVEKCDELAIDGVCTYCSEYGMVFDPMFDKCVEEESTCASKSLTTYDQHRCKTCVEAGMYWDGVQCVGQCPQIHNEASECTTCSETNGTHWDLISEQCVEECDQILVGDTCTTCNEQNNTFWNGQECVDLCPQIYDELGACITCQEKDGKFWNGYECVEKCDQIDIDGVCTTCAEQNNTSWNQETEECTAQCAQISMDGVCKTCLEYNMNWNGYGCTYTCNQIAVNGICTTCNEYNNTFWNGYECVETCPQTSDNGYCVTCQNKDNTFWNGEECVQTCPQTSDNGYCVTCQNKDNTFWNGEECVATCDEINVDGVCTTCQEYDDSFWNGATCEPIKVCDAESENYIENNNTCECKEGYIRNKDNICKRKQKNGVVIAVPIVVVILIIVIVVIIILCKRKNSPKKENDQGNTSPARNDVSVANEEGNATDNA